MIYSIVNDKRVGVIEDSLPFLTDFGHKGGRVSAFSHSFFQIKGKHLTFTLC